MVVRGDGLSSRAIEGFGGGWPSHMANLLDDGTVWDARDDLVSYKGITYPRGVQNRPAGYLYDQYSQWMVFTAPRVTELAYGRWVHALETQVGKPYDQAGIWDFVVGMLKGSYRDRNYAITDAEQSKAWFCDEYSVWAAGLCGMLPWPLPFPVYTFTPGSALNLFIGAGWELSGQKVG